MCTSHDLCRLNRQADRDARGKNEKELAALRTELAAARAKSEAGLSDLRDKGVASQVRPRSPG